jgi:transposase-like protein
MRGERISDEIRQQVAGALLAGVGVSEVSRRYSLPKSTVCLIKSQLPVQVEHVGRPTRESLDELIADSLRSNLRAQRNMTDVASEPEYIRGQSAAQVAELYEVLADHAVRLLEAAAIVEPVGTDP